MARPHIEFVQVADAERETVADGLLAGTARRPCSADDADGSWTALHTFGAGWSGEVGGTGRPLELFVLAGELTVGDSRIATGCYAHLPAGLGRCAARTDGGAHAIVLLDPERPGAAGGPVDVVDPAALRWVNPALGESDIPPGICIKLLHEDAETGDWTWVAAVLPGWQENRAEIHDTIEECLVLRGDILLGMRGELGPGCYFWRPPLVRHGPMFSHEGAMFFFRSKGGNLSVEYEEVPGWQGLVDDYVRRRTFYAGTTR